MRVSACCRSPIKETILGLFRCSYCWRANREYLEVKEPISIIEDELSLLRDLEENRRYFYAEKINKILPLMEHEQQILEKLAALRIKTESDFNKAEGRP